MTVHKKILKLYFYTGKLYRKERFIFLTRNGFYACGWGYQFQLGNFEFLKQLDFRFNG